MTQDFGKVAVLMGGPSAEREISLQSGQAVLEALKSRGVDAHGIDARDRHVLAALEEAAVDRVFIALHGRWGEDGVIQGALEVLGLPYTGSGVLGSAIAMDKRRTKQLWKGIGLPTPEFVLLGNEQDLEDAVTHIGYPLAVKPAREGSSIGISKATSWSGLQQAWQAARELDDVVIAEQWIEGTELTAAILGNDALPLIRLEAAGEFYDYEAKYVSDDTGYICPCGLPEQQEATLQELALKAFEATSCSGWGRVDLMLDKAQRPYLIEVNTVPGMTSHSLVPMAAAEQGLDFADLCLRILETAVD
jgi:D-alanine-D-alanine ligase